MSALFLLSLVIIAVMATNASAECTDDQDLLLLLLLLLLQSLCFHCDSFFASFKVHRLCTGVLVRSIEQDSKLDQAVVTLLTVASDRILAVLTPPEAVPQQPLTLALLQVRLEALHPIK